MGDFFNLLNLKTMVTIVDYKPFQKENGETFFGLVVQGGVEPVKSKVTGRLYLTARTATVATTFNEVTCKTLVGSTLNGNVKKVNCDAYDYTVPESGEQLLLTHRYEYISEEEEIVNKNVMPKEKVF